MSGYSPYPQAPQGNWVPGNDQRGYLQGGPTGFGAAISEGFKNAFDYQGRASQGAYWWFALFNVLVVIVLYIIVFAIAATTKSFYGFILVGIYGIVAFFPGLALEIRRLHDTDRSGWWIFISLVPFVGGIWLLVLMCLDGTPGPNRYDGIQYAQQPPVPYGQQPPAGPYAQQPPAAGYQQPGGYQQPPAGYQQQPGGYQQPPPGYQQPPAGY